MKFNECPDRIRSQSLYIRTMSHNAYSLTSFKLTYLIAGLNFMFVTVFLSLEVKAQTEKSQSLHIPDSQQNHYVIKGRLIDRSDNLSVPFANVVLSQNETVIAGAQSKFDGYFELVCPETIDLNSKVVLECSFVGYSTDKRTSKLSDFVRSFIEIKMRFSNLEIHPCYGRPIYTLINKDGSNGQTIERSAILRMP